MTQNPTLSGFMLLASMTLAMTAAAQQSSPPPDVQPALPPAAQPIAAPTPPVLPAEQVVPTELTGLLGHAVVDAVGAELGRIVDLLVDGQGRVRAVVVDVGGFMGVGNRKVAVA